MIKEIQVRVSGTLFVFDRLKYSQKNLEAMWEMLYKEICKDGVLSISPYGDILIRASSIDFANKVIEEEQND